MQDLITIRSSVLPESTRVAGFRGVEGLSRPYEFDIYLVMTHDVGQDFDMADAISAKATLILDRHDGRPPFLFHGMLASVELVHEFLGRAVFRAVLVPHLWQLTQTLHSRLFTGKSVPDIIKDILEEGGLSADEYEFRLRSSYPPEEHVCQYRESDFDFISRWMEREGMYYFFEQGDDGEKLIITDDKSFHQPLLEKAVRYFPQTGEDTSAGESLRTFSCRHVSLPASVRLKDYNYAKPALDVSGTASVSPNGIGEISIYGHRFFTPAQGKRLANLRAEELRARQVVAQGLGTQLYLRPGYTFELEEHPRLALNMKYLTTGLVHFGNQTQGAPELKDLIGVEYDDVYKVQVTAIPADVQYRAELKTPWPRIDGYEHGVVDGPANSEYAQIDEQGRYAVKFNFDESSLKDGKASTWVRMLQPHGGAIEGWHFPLRKATEVLVIFLGGDPDRPVIAGVVPNAVTPSPVTSANNTKNVIQTGGRNRVEMEDQAGIQRITVYTPTKNTMLRMGAPNDNHNMILTTDGTGLIHTGESMDVRIDSWKHEIVGDFITEDFKGPFRTNVTLDVFETYMANKTEKVSSGHVDETYKSQMTYVTDLRESNHGTEKTTVRGTVDEEYQGKHTTTVTAGGRKEEVTGLYEQIAHNGEKLTVEGGLFHTKALSNYRLEVTGLATESASSRWKISAPSVRVTGTTIVTIGPKKILVNGSELIKLNGSTKIEIAGGDIAVNGGHITVEGGQIDITGTSPVTIKGSVTTVEGAPVNIKGGDVNVNGGTIKLNC